MARRFSDHSVIKLLHVNFFFSVPYIFIAECLYWIAYLLHADIHCKRFIYSGDWLVNTVKHVYNDTLGATKVCCYNQVVVIRKFSTKTIESIPAMCFVVKRLML